MGLLSFFAVRVFALPPHWHPPHPAVDTRECRRGRRAYRQNVQLKYKAKHQLDRRRSCRLGVPQATSRAQRAVGGCCGAPAGRCCIGPSPWSRPDRFSRQPHLVSPGLSPPPSTELAPATLPNSKSTPDPMAATLSPPIGLPKPVLAHAPMAASEFAVVREDP